MDYSAELMKACGAALITAISLNMLGRAPHGVSAALRIGGGVLIFGAVLLVLRQNTEALRGILVIGEAGGEVGSAFSLMLKALGVALLSRFCADFCKDCGESGLASGVESMGKIVTVSLSLPLLSEILKRVAEISKL